MIDLFRLYLTSNLKFFSSYRSFNEEKLKILDNNRNDLDKLKEELRLKKEKEEKLLHNEMQAELE